jgi:hypothetical protein
MSTDSFRARNTHEVGPKTTRFTSCKRSKSAVINSLTFAVFYSDDAESLLRREDGALVVSGSLRGRIVKWNRKGNMATVAPPSA